MSYNLTENQKDILRWIVTKVRGDELSEEFQVIWVLESNGFILNGYKGDKAELPKISTTTLDALAEAKLIRVIPSYKTTEHGIQKEINRVCSLTGLSYMAVDNNFQELPPQMAQITIGALIHNMSGGYVQAVGVANEAEISQIANDPELLQTQVKVLFESLTNEVTSELNVNDQPIYFEATQEFQEQLLSENPNHTKIQRLVRVIGFLGDIEGTISLMTRVWSILYPLLLILAYRFPEL